MFSIIFSRSCSSNFRLMLMVFFFICSVPRPKINRILLFLLRYFLFQSSSFCFLPEHTKWSKYWKHVNRDHSILALFCCYTLNITLNWVNSVIFYSFMYCKNHTFLMTEKSSINIVFCVYCQGLFSDQNWSNLMSSPNCNSFFVLSRSVVWTLLI